MKAMTRTWLFLGLAALAIPFAGCGGGGGGGGGGLGRLARPAIRDCRVEDRGPRRQPADLWAGRAIEVVLNFGGFGPYIFPCSAGTGATDSGLPVGNYEFSMQLLAPGGTVLSDTTVGNPPVAYPIYSCPQDDIPDVVFGIQ